MNGVLHGCMIKRCQRVTLGDKDLTDCSSLLAKSRKLASEFVNLQLSVKISRNLREIHYCFLIPMLIRFS